ncbi:DoxX family protein [Candidatus Woesearchaeota archaeon]|nr:DoxX family protein [Candidatus Woesearchaeota archaeon]
MSDLKGYAPLMLRIGLGILFIFMGIGKFQNTSGTIQMLQGIGFPLPIFWAWLLLLSEIIFGVCLLLGLKVKYTTIPLIIIILVAIVTVQFKNLPQSQGNLLKDFSILMSLVALMMIGPGKLAVNKN